MSSSDSSIIYSQSFQRNPQRGGYSFSTENAMKSSQDYSVSPPVNYHHHHHKSKKYTGPVFYCQFCSNKKFKSEQYLEDHMRRRHMHLMEKFNSMHKNKEKHQMMEAKLMETQSYFDNLFNAYQMRNDFNTLQTQIADLQKTMLQERNEQAKRDAMQEIQFKRGLNMNTYDGEFDNLRREEKMHYDDLKNQLEILKSTMGLKDSKINKSLVIDREAAHRSRSHSKDNNKLDVKIKINQGGNEPSNIKSDEMKLSTTFEGPTVKQTKFRKGQQLIGDGEQNGEEGIEQDLTSQGGFKGNTGTQIEFKPIPQRVEVEVPMSQADIGSIANLDNESAFQRATYDYDNNICTKVRYTVNNYTTLLRENPVNRNKQLLVDFYHAFHRRDQSTKNLKNCNTMLL
ncbi:MAG: hypothetical protein MJ252_06735 [archaeon]|nr:hypothetical protein [archaeon]